MVTNMTLEQYITKVIQGKILYTPLEYSVTSPIDTSCNTDDMDFEYSCDETYHDGHYRWACTRSNGHEGTHIARQSDGTYCAHWE
jgi:hypothetical protein